MPEYKNSKIYTVRCRDDQSLIYVGSTTQLLSQRFNDHKRHAKNPNHKSYNIYFYQVMREKGIDNFYIELYNECPCENREQLTKQEGKLIREIGTINSRIAGRTDKEYQEDNKDKIKEYDKQRYINNKEKFKEQAKLYRERNKEKYESNKKQIYEKNKNHILEKLGTVITCDCGCNITFGSKKRHEKSKRHLDLIDAKNSQQNTEQN